MFGPDCDLTQVTQLTDCRFQDELVRELRQTLSSIKLEEKGVYVQASTLGSLEALLEFLRTSKVPVSNQLLEDYPLVTFAFWVNMFCVSAVRRDQHRPRSQEGRDEGVDDARA